MRWLIAVLCVASATSACKKPVSKALSGPVEWVSDPLPVSDPKTELSAIAGSGPNDVWAVGWGLFHWDGKSWSKQTPPELEGYGTAMKAISVVARDDVWAVGVNGRLAHFDGKTWHPEQLEVARVSRDPAIKGYFDLFDVIAWPGEVWVTASGHEYYRYRDKEWAVVRAPEIQPRSFQQIWGTSPHDVWLPGGLMLHNDGDHWGPPAKLTGAYRKIHGSAPDDVWAAGWKGHHKDDHGSLAHFDGTTWTEPSLPAGTPLLWSLHVHSKQRAYAVGNAGWALAWDGTSWRPSPTGTNAILKDVYVTEGVAFAVGNLGPRVLRRVE